MAMQLEAKGTSEKLQAALKTLEQGIESIVDSDGFRRYLACMSKFHSYSWGNICLILAQCPEASHVAGYKRWQELGRQVRKGEKGIVILAPLTRKVTQPGAEETSSVVVGFRVTHVFDIAQTEGEPLPKPPIAEAIRTNTDTGEELYRCLEQWLVSEAVSVEIGQCGSANGYYQPGTKRIVLSARIQGTDQATKTLAHEAGHYVADHRGFMPREDAETVAEAAAYCVLSYFGLDSSEYSFPYISCWAEDQSVLKRNLEAIQRTADLILDGLDTLCAP